VVTFGASTLIVEKLDKKIINRDPQSMHTHTKCTPRLKKTLPPSKIDKMVDEERIEKALNALNRQLIPNYSTIAKEFEIEHTTLMRRH